MPKRAAVLHLQLEPKLHRAEDDPTQKALISSAMDAISDLRRDAALGIDTKPAIEYLIPVDVMIASWL
jgi:hypothetical protein